MKAEKPGALGPWDVQRELEGRSPFQGLCAETPGSFMVLDASKRDVLLHAECWNATSNLADSTWMKDFSISSHSSPNHPFAWCVSKNSCPRKQSNSESLWDSPKELHSCSKGMQKGPFQFSSASLKILCWQQGHLAQIKVYYFCETQITQHLEAIS